MRAVIEAAGIRDVLAKSLGSSNPANVVKATLDALTTLRPRDEIFKIRGKAIRVKSSSARRGLSYETARSETQSRRQAPPQAPRHAAKAPATERPPAKGHKGQKARSGGSIRPGFEGGQMPLHRRLPKRGFNNAAFKTVYGIVNLDDLEKRFDDGAAINEKLLRGAGLVRGSLDGIKVLGRGDVNKKFHLEVDSISASAREKIEKAGGTITLTGRKSDAGTAEIEPRLFSSSYIPLRMISAFTNIFKIPELRQRVLFTLAMIVIIRAGSAITTPGVNAEILREWFRNVADAQSAGGVASLFNLFSGGALAHCAIFSLGIMPYISASIMMQLLTAVVPQLGKLAREDGGRRKIMQYTRYATIALCIFQGYLLAKSFENPQANPFLPGIMDTINRLGIGSGS